MTKITKFSNEMLSNVENIILAAKIANFTFVLRAQICTTKFDCDSKAVKKISQRFIFRILQLATFRAKKSRNFIYSHAAALF